MSENLLILSIISAMLCSIMFIIFIFNAINNLADALDGGSYIKGYYCKAIAFGIFSIIAGYVLYLIIGFLFQNI